MIHVCKKEQCLFFFLLLFHQHHLRSIGIGMSPKENGIVTVVIIIIVVVFVVVVVVVVVIIIIINTQARGMCIDSNDAIIIIIIVIIGNYQEIGRSRGHRNTVQVDNGLSEVLHILGGEVEKGLP